MVLHNMFWCLQKVQEVQLRKDQELLNHQLQKAVLGRSVLNTKADIKTGVGHKTRIVKEPVDSNAWHKILSKEIAKRRKVGYLSLCEGVVQYTRIKSCHDVFQYSSV